VVGTFGLDTPNWPGRAYLNQVEPDCCSSLWEVYVGEAPIRERLGLFTFEPTQAGRSRGDRTVTCAAIRTGRSMLTAPIR
jgi:hypothetical protein